jgi:hypothetical protein
MSKNAAIGVGVAVVVVALAIVAVKTKVLVAALTPVTVNINSNCMPSLDPVKILPEGQVTWFAVDQDYKLNFATSPFTNIPSGQDVGVGKAQSLSSGGVLLSIKLGCVFGCSRQYKYSIKGQGQGCPYDPVVIIDK